MSRWLSLLFPFLVACSAANVSERGPGAYDITCRNQNACIEKANQLCGARGFRVEGARRQDKVAGSPGNEIQLTENTLSVRCVDAALPQPTSVSSAPTRGPSVPAAPAQICRPGETQRCVGPGACAGGQACLADGSGFGACDCGPVSSPPQALPDAGT